MLLGDTVRRFRMASGLSQSALAAKADVSPSFLSLVERGKREPGIGVLRRLAAVLEVPVGVLLAAALAVEDVQATSPSAQESLRRLLEAVRLELLTAAAMREQTTLFPVNANEPSAAG